MSPRVLRHIPTIVALALIAATASLGNWQQRRAEEKSRLQHERDRALAAPPLALTARLLEQTDVLQARRVSARGAFLDQHTVFIDNRSLRGVAGFHVLTPFAVDALERPVLVLRGWVAQDPAQRNRLPTIASPTPPVRIEALVQRDLEPVFELGKAPAPGPGDRLWQNAGIDSMARWSGLALAPVVLRQVGHDDPAPARSSVVPVRDWASPGAGIDKHRAYALQWYSMAALVLIVWSVSAWRARRPQR